MRQTFSKEERLSSRKLIQELVTKGKSFSVAPFRAVWLPSNLKTKFPVQVLMTVPKSNFKKAVQRNTLRRRMREAYRKNKTLIYNTLAAKQKQITVMLVYTSKTETDYPETEKKIILILQRLCGELENFFKK